MRTADSGKSYCYARVIVNDRQRNDNGTYTNSGTLAYNLTVFGSAAEQLARVADLSGNIRVVFAGRYNVREFTRKDGSTGTSHDVVVDELGASLTGQAVIVDRDARTASSPQDAGQPAQ